MLQNLLTALPEGGKMISVPESLLYALIGFIVVFAGIALLIAVIWAVGKVMTYSAPVAKQPKAEVKVQPVQSAPANSDEVDEETVAVITAALMAYYQTNKPQCGFTVKRIKRI